MVSQIHDEIFEFKFSLLHKTPQTSIEIVKNDHILAIFTIDFQSL